MLFQFVLLLLSFFICLLHKAPRWIELITSHWINRICGTHAILHALFCTTAHILIIVVITIYQIVSLCQKACLELRTFVINIYVRECVWPCTWGPLIFILSHWVILMMSWPRLNKFTDIIGRLLYWREHCVVLFIICLLLGHHWYHLLHHLFLRQWEPAFKVFLFYVEELICVKIFKLVHEHWIIFIIKFIHCPCPSLSEQEAFNVRLEFRNHLILLCLLRCLCFNFLDYSCMSHSYKMRSH